MLDILFELEKNNKNIKTAILGAGRMGRAIFYQCSITPGLDCIGISDIKIEKAIDTAKMFGFEYKIIYNEHELEHCVRNNIIAICEDGILLSDYEPLDVFTDASTEIVDAVNIDALALNNGTHLVMMNAEADLTFGPYLNNIAQRNKLVYTTCDGDQPGVIKRIVDEIELWGFKAIMLGNIKGFLDYYSNPTKIIPEADKRKLEYKMCTAFTDGTKVNIEMSLLANALDGRVLKSGMNGIRMEKVTDVFKHYDFEQLNNCGLVVEYILGATPKGGVFVVGYCGNDFQQDLLNYLTAGTIARGDFNLFYRPYHLCHIESVRTIIEATLNNKSLLKPNFGFKTNVIAYAKRDIKAGEILDGIGGYLCYGLIENIDKSNNDQGLPICIADKILVKNDIKKDHKIYMKDVHFDKRRSDFKYYELSQTI